MSYCVDEINRYRSSIALPALTRSPELEAFAALSAQIDNIARQPHLHFTQTNGGGIALAENELLWWPNRSVRAVIQQGLATMWAEGPGG